jgi:hypothetical protein
MSSGPIKVRLISFPSLLDLRQCWKTNAIRNGLHPLIADVIIDLGDTEKDVKSLYLTITDEYLVREIDRRPPTMGK